MGQVQSNTPWELRGGLGWGRAPTWMGKLTKGRPKLHSQESFLIGIRRISSFRGGLLRICWLLSEFRGIWRCRRGLFTKLWQVYWCCWVIYVCVEADVTAPIWIAYPVYAYLFGENHVGCEALCNFIEWHIIFRHTKSVHVLQTLRKLICVPILRQHTESLLIIHFIIWF